ncbi:7-alpha-hydroxysteroid dehydrogenase [Meinhardsimonia xiamenensis]|jgi:7-alpha-hydroxysteroid dehydrogenase|uniref:7-alpha-hydroxysteroid dehydrogenase n=1 Tax=Meinhardsimonia xiamenensis TaxID=990712 RepID=A0A1G8ZAR1_9RHOB|nr:SDR family oxidoreductase [Meinhardsimonia xiamenensis]PRX37625.1 7-alpha-hydroxysteroid dehydrogenase [Meinhardsimonia xiamenensis]SDK12151.1 7-alpha-hydroxysteroid dehydrogenase [Meinhardsimonia xiamenensis]
MTFSISGKTAIVTGGANGIGLAIARHFISQGANVMLADMDEARLKDECGPVEDGEGGNVRFFAGDLREKLTLANLLSATIDAFDRVDILVNACRRVALADSLNPDDETVEEMLDHNLFTALRLSRLVARRMIRQAREEGREEGTAGAIINLSSIAAQRLRPELLGFSVASAAVEQLTRGLAVALAPHRIRVNAIAFGSVMSASLKDALKGNDAYREEIVEKTPLGRIASAREVAETAQYLASEGAAFMTGQVLVIDGGRTLIDPVTPPAH